MHALFCGDDVDRLTVSIHSVWSRNYEQNYIYLLKVQRGKLSSLLFTLEVKLSYI